MPAKAKPLPPLEVLQEHFSYDPETGVISRLKGQHLGPISRTDPKGYVVIG